MSSLLHHESHPICRSPITTTTTKPLQRTLLTILLLTSLLTIIITTHTNPFSAHPTNPPNPFPFARPPTPATRSTPTNITNPPKFIEEILQAHRANGYWVELIDITGNHLPDILAFGIIQGTLVWYQNPYTEPTKQYTRPWKRRTIDNLFQPIGMDHANIGGGAYNDFVIATAFGGSPYTINNTGGQIYYYQNPLNAGGNIDDPWQKRYIGRATGSHRIRLGHYTQKKRLQLLAVPVAGSYGNPYSPISVTLFTVPDDLVNAPQWDAFVVDHHHFHVAHGVVAGKFRGEEHLDSAIISSMEGITWLYFDGHAWKRQQIAPGVPRSIPAMKEPGRDVFWGCQNVDVGTIGGDSNAYIAVTGPFHGNVVLIYMKETGSPGSIENATWRQFYVHNFDSMTPIVDASGPLHQIAAADLDNDGDDELLIASKKKGTYYAKITDIGTGLFQITCLTQAPATRLSVDDIDGDGLLDFATIGNTIHTERGRVDSKLNVYHNIQS